MKFRDYFYFIRKRNLSDKKMFVLGYLLSIICFALVCFILSFPWIFNRAFKDVDELLPTGIENCVVIDYESVLSEDHLVSRTKEGNKFIFDLLAADEIYGIGAFDRFWSQYELSADGISYAGQMNKISQENSLDFGQQRHSDAIQTIGYSYYFKDFYKFSLYKGSFDVDEALENGDSVLYLGYNFRDIPIGAYQTDINLITNKPRKISVAGIIDQGEEIINIQSASTDFHFAASYGYNLDNCIIWINGRYSDDDYIALFNTIPVAFNEGTDFISGVDTIETIAKENGIRINAVSMENKIKTQLAAYDVTLNAVLGITPIAFIITFIIILSVQLLISVLRNDEVGVWLSNGLTRRQIKILFLLDNVKKMVVSAILGIMISDIYLSMMLGLSEGEIKRIFADVYVYGAICTIGIAIITSLLLAFLSYIFIGRRSLPDIINNSEHNTSGKQIFRANRLFTCLYILSFVALFYVLYCGIYVYREYTDIENGKKSCRYSTNYSILINNYADETVQPDIDFSKGNLYEYVRLPIGTEEYGDHWAYLVMKQNEPLLETVNGGVSIGIVENTDIPSCVIGDRWTDNIYYCEGEPYIKIYGTEVKVLGVFDSTSLEERDKRFYVFRNTLSPEIMLNWFGYGYDRGIFEGMMVYSCSSSDSDIDIIVDWLTQTYGENNYSITRTESSWSANDDEVRHYMKLMKGIIAALSIVSVFNLLFLVVVWSRAYAYEFMIKRIYGYSVLKLLPGIMKTIFLYEIVSLFLAILMTIGYEIIVHDIENWIKTVANGYSFVLIVLAGITYILSIKPLSWIAEACPTEFIKRTEK